MHNVNFNLKLSCDNSWHMDRPHFHEDIEVVLCLSDGGNFFINNKLYPLKSGRLFLINEAVLHRSIADSDYRRYILHIPLSSLTQLSTSKTSFKSFLTAPCLYKNLEKEDTEKLCRSFFNCETFKENSFGSDIKRIMGFAYLLLEVFGNFQNAEGEVLVQDNVDFERVTPILNYISEHLSELLTLDIISSSFFINKYHLCHIFKEATGFSVMEYIIHLRVIKARGLLRTGMRVQEVSEAVGFQNNQHFIRTFGNLTGTSPKKYANEYLVGYKE